MQTANSCMHTVTNKRKVVSLHLFWNVQNNCTSVLHNQSVNFVYDPGIIRSLSTASVNLRIQFMKKCTILTNHHNSDMTVEADNADHTVTCWVTGNARFHNSCTNSTCGKTFVSHLYSLKKTFVLDVSYNKIYFKNSIFPTSVHVLNEEKKKGKIKIYTFFHLKMCNSIIMFKWKICIQSSC